jgi:hypothetical protein
MFKNRVIVCKIAVCFGIDMGVVNPLLMLVVVVAGVVRFSRYRLDAV